MNRFATSILALALAGAGSTALAEQTKDQISTQTAKPQPVQMSDAQLDAVAGGALIVVPGGGLVDVVVNNVTILEDVEVRVLNDSLNDLTIQIPVAANIAASVVALGGNAAALARQFGRQF